MIRLKTKIFIRILALLITFTIALSVLITGFLFLDKRNHYINLYEISLAHVGNRVDQLLQTDNNEDKIRGVLRSLLSRGTVIIYSFLEKEGVKFIQAQRKGYDLTIPEICLSLEAKSSVIKFDLEFGVIYNVSTPILKKGYYDSYQRRFGDSTSVKCL